MTISPGTEAGQLRRRQRGRRLENRGLPSGIARRHQARGRVDLNDRAGIALERGPTRPGLRGRCPTPVWAEAVAAAAAASAARIAVLRCIFMKGLLRVMTGPLARARPSVNLRRWAIGELCGIDKVPSSRE